MSWIIFDERGERAQKFTWLAGTGQVIAGWGVRASPTMGSRVLGFYPERTWRPTYFAAKMARGYRLFGIDIGVVDYLDANQITDAWQPATRIAFGREPPAREKRFPTIASLEMYVRTVCAQ